MPHACPHLLERFCEHARDRPHQLALVVDDRALTYGELHAAAVALAGDLTRALAPEDITIAVSCSRSEFAYVAILATLMAGRAYVPISPRSPPARNALVLAASRPRIMLGDELGVIAAMSIEPTCHPTGQMAVLQSIGPCLEPRASSLGPLAYVMFTSGSTGVPKGVLVTQANVVSYVSTILERHAPQPGDRFSQVPELTFDLSVHDLFVCWSAGGSLHPITGDVRIGAAEFIRKQQITHWTSVPSAIMFMKRLGLLTPNAFLELRMSMFCGEGLSLELAEAWQRAAPTCVIDNLYGPTEATVAITGHRYTAESHNETGLVPIGLPFARQAAVALDEAMQEVPAGTPGELYLAGDQLTAGYWANPDATAEKFVARPDVAGRWYRTGDLVVESKTHGFLFLSRTDDQIKILGHRVQLSDVEHAVRTASKCNDAVAIGWPEIGPGAAGAIVVFVGAETVDGAAIVRSCQDLVPPYMVPRRVIAIAQLPLNANGKVDRRALRQLLANGYT